MPMPRGWLASVSSTNNRIRTKIRICQAKFIEGTLLFHLPLERNTLPRQFVEWFSDDQESRNKPPIVISEANEALELFDVYRGWPRSDSLDLVRVNFDAI